MTLDLNTIKARAEAAAALAEAAKQYPFEWYFTDKDRYEDGEKYFWMGCAECGLCADDNVTDTSTIAHSDVCKTAVAERVPALAADVLALLAERTQMAALLKRLHEWDVMSTGDGEYWKSEIGKVLA